VRDDPRGPRRGSPAASTSYTKPDHERHPPSAASASPRFPRASALDNVQISIQDTAAPALGPHRGAALVRPQARDRPRGSRSSVFPLTLKHRAFTAENLDRVGGKSSRWRSGSAPTAWSWPMRKYVGLGAFQSRRAAADARAARSRPAPVRRRTPASGCAGRMEVLFVTPRLLRGVSQSVQWMAGGRRFIVISPRRPRLAVATPPIPSPGFTSTR